MLSALRAPVLRQVSILRAGARALPSAQIVSPPVRLAPSVRTLSTAPTNDAKPKKKPNFSRWTRICFNCRREGHIHANCPEPTICYACGVEGHERGECLNPDPQRLAALGSGPQPCFRCGVEGHLIRDCPQPPKCFICGSGEHRHKDCPGYVAKPESQVVFPQATGTPVVEA